MTLRKKRDTAEAKRWLIVGAFQAGASEKHVARISGLSRTAVRNIILNYRRTGTPCIPKKIPNKIRQKLIVEYDENGEIINTDDDDQEEQPKRTFKKKKKHRKSSVWFEKDAQTTAINNIIDQMRISEQGVLEPPVKRNSLPAKLPPPSKYEQDIRGYEPWTHEDDMILLNHVLHHLYAGGWSELEVRFNGRHSARLCYDRWKYLRSLLLKGITDKPSMSW